ncbi:MAG: cation:proton antiporter [Gemmatimonadota bacterium]
MPKDLAYIVLLFLLFVVPKLLQRFRLPAAITSLLLGVLATQLGWSPNDDTLGLLSTLGIVALFLLAGLDVDLDELRPNTRVLVQHLSIWIVTLIATVAIAMMALHLTIRPATLLSLALITPSTGFILDSLHRFGLTPDEERWTKAKAISSEIVALGAMFVALRSGSFEELTISLVVLVGLIVLLPPVFRWFAVTVSPYAPKSEFAFLLMVAMVSAYVTRHLGVYYLVGAFVAGLAARQFRDLLPAMSSERMLHAVEAFASVFIPFYFFKAGLDIIPQVWGGWAVVAGAVMTVVFISLRVGEISLHRWIALRERPAHAVKIAIALLPTLVFSLVCVELMRERFQVPEYLLGGVVLYTILNTLVPGIALKVQPPSYEDPHPGWGKD